MNKLSENIVGGLLDKLLKYGDTRLRDTEDGKEIAEGLESLLGYQLGTTDTGFKVLKEIRPKLMSRLDDVAAAMALRAAEVVEDLDTEVTKRSFLMAWPDLAGSARAIVVLLVVLMLAATGFSGYELYLARAITVEMVAFTVGIPAVTLLVLAAVPIKSVAYLGLQAASRMVDAKLAPKKR